MDRRDLVAVQGNWYDKFDERTMLATIEQEDGDIEIRCKYEVCGTCQGKGSHVNPSIDAHGLTAEDFAEDPDFAEDYCSGLYDVPCAECHGRNVVPVPDEACLTDEGREALLQAEAAQDERVQQERYCRMESGDYGC